MTPKLKADTECCLCEGSGTLYTPDGDGGVNKEPCVCLEDWYNENVEEVA